MPETDFDPRTDNRQRPPGRDTYHTTALLIVTPTFLPRADNTPATERLVDEGSNKGRHGRA